ncbi:MAG: hypothetical protein AB1791_15765 [Chloroflexota bacterium]
MKVAGQAVQGRLVQKEGLVYLLWQETAAPLTLRLALVEQGSEQPFWPSFVLDDWGQEIKGLELYDWLQENGLRFPRAEVFGYDQSGRSDQCFMRALDHSARYLCYAYPDDQTPLTEGILLEGVLWTQAGTAGVQPVGRPAAVTAPLRHARLRWWLVDPETILDFGFSILDWRPGK